MNKIEGNGTGSFHLAERKDCRGAVLLVHGLNMDPLAWKDMVEFLNFNSLSVYMLTLKGHRGRDFRDMREVSKDIWVEQFMTGYRAITSLLPEKPVYLLGYSLGCLLGIVSQLRSGSSLFQRQVLLAPALSLRCYTYLALPVTAVVPRLPSRSPSYYIANREGTPARAYRALFSLKREFNSFSVEKKRMLDIPTQVYMRPNDELISYAGILKMIERYRLRHWQMTTLPRHKRTWCELTFRHLIVDEKSAGENTWAEMSAQIGAFLQA